jgi:hypothetical protein
MRRTYAVTWQEPETASHSGKLEFLSHGLSLEGSNGDGPLSVLVPYDELLGMQIAPVRERLDGRPTLVLERATGRLRIASVVQPGVVSELAERVASFRMGRRQPNNRIAVIVPIRKRKRDKVKRLLEHGPPFDPHDAGLERHQVFLSDSEVVFLFEAAPGFSLSKLLDNAGVLSIAAAWHDCVAGRTRVAEPYFSWVAARDPNGLFFGPTPGPGDSDGGDIYAP